MVCPSKSEGEQPSQCLFQCVPNCSITMSSDSSPTDSMGRCERIPPPIDMSWRAPDPDELVAVILRISQVRLHPARSQHWALVWDIPYKDRSIRTNRILHVVMEHGHKHYTNWGALTKFVTEDDQKNSREVVIGVMDLSQRRQLEGIADSTAVCLSDPDWNGQDWIETVLREAVDVGLLKSDQFNLGAVLFAARAA